MSVISRLVGMGHTEVRAARTCDLDLCGGFLTQHLDSATPAEHTATPLHVSTCAASLHVDTCAEVRAGLTRPARVAVLLVLCCPCAIPACVVRQELLTWSLGCSQSSVASRQNRSRS